MNRFIAACIAVFVTVAYAAGSVKGHAAAVLAVLRDAGAVLCVLSAAGIAGGTAWAVTRQRHVPRPDDGEIDLAPLIRPRAVRSGESSRAVTPGKARDACVTAAPVPVPGRRRHLAVVPEPVPEPSGQPGLPAPEQTEVPR